jgi:hypothetical protein
LASFFGFSSEVASRDLDAGGRRRAGFEVDRHEQLADRLGADPAVKRVSPYSSCARDTRLLGQQLVCLSGVRPGSMTM